jgi:anti-sigma regulatory factor (Ser/Thr protein kinase)
MPYYRCAACGLTSYSAVAHSSAGACPTCGTALTVGARRFVTPGSKHDVNRTFRARPQAAAEARRTLAGLALPECTRNDLALLVSELVTNSVRHAGLSAADPVRVELTNGAGSVRLAVHDGGDGFSPSSGPVDPLAVGGQGLAIVASLSETWGVECDRDGCTVWCEVAVPEEPGAVGDREVTARFVSKPPAETVRAAAPTGA